MTKHTITAALQPGGGGSISGPPGSRRFKVWICQAWRLDDGPVRHERTRLMLELFSKEEHETVATEIGDELVVGATGTVLDSDPLYNPIFGMPDRGGHLLIERDLAPANDDELEAIAADFRRARSVRHALGAFTFDPRLTWFDGRARWKRYRFNVSIHAREEDEALRELDRVAAALDSGDLSIEGLRSYAVDELLETARSWHERPLSAEDFARSLRLESLVTHGDGYTAYLEDRRNIFLGHVVEVRGSISEGPQEALIAG